jgi:hypothetical protein
VTISRRGFFGALAGGAAVAAGLPVVAKAVTCEYDTVMQERINHLNHLALVERYNGTGYLCDATHTHTMWARELPSHVHTMFENRFDAETKLAAHLELDVTPGPLVIGASKVRDAERLEKPKKMTPADIARERRMLRELDRPARGRAE